MKSPTPHVHAQWDEEKCVVFTQALGSYTTARTRPGPCHCPTIAHGTLGRMGSLCANELFLNNDQTWFRE